MKKSEARILIYISQATNPNKFVRQISSKLEIDYGYLLKILAMMVSKEWLFKHRHRNKCFYDLTASGQKLLETAKQKLTKESE